MKKLLFALFFALLAHPAYAACSGTSPNLTAANNTPTEINLCVTAAVDGDIITVPAGSQTWTSGVTVSGKGISIKCATHLGCIVTDNIVGIAFQITRDATHAFELRDFKIVRGTGGTNYLHISGDGKAPLIHDNYFDAKEIVGGVGHVFDFTSKGGKFHNNQVIAGTVKPSTDGTCSTNGDYHYGPVGFQQLGDPGGDNSWNAGTIGGDADTTGEENLYIEDNYFEGILNQSWDAEGGSRIVVRYNTFQDAAVVLHGADTDLNGGVRWFEFYGNTFNRVYSDANLNYFVWIRGGSGVFIGNTFDLAGSEGGDGSPSCYMGRYDIKFTVQNLRRNDGEYACWDSGDGGYPAPHQIGQTTHARDSTPDFPVAIAANIGAGAASSLLAGLEEYDMSSGNYCPGSPDSVVDYVHADRDYVKQVSTTINSGGTSSSTPFNGTTGTGYGTIGNRPNSCTRPTMYWATDEGGNWNTINGTANDGKLYICTATNTWTSSWTPKEYPIPNRTYADGGGGGTPEGATPTGDGRGPNRGRRLGRR